MPKKLSDLKIDPHLKKTNLKGAVSQNPLKKNADKLVKKNSIKKRSNPITTVKDINSSEKNNYIYIRGKKFSPPKYLDNLLKIGVLGFLIIFAFNLINVYIVGKTLEQEISATAYEGYNFLVDAGKSATKIQFDQALETFNKASANFTQAQDELWFISKDNSFYAQDNPIGYAATALLNGGKHFASAGKFFLEALEDFNKIPLYFVSKNDPKVKNPPSLTETLKDGLEKTNQAITDISQASDYIKDIETDSLPPEVRSRVTFAQSKVEEVSQLLKATSEHFPALLKLLGDRYPHRFLILLQNNNEIRPTGGFIGSYAIVDLNDGYIEKLEVHDVYDIDGSYGGIITPPEEFLTFTSNWRFRDSNYSPDFEVSAKKARWFLDKQGGPTVDTVIAINQGLLKDLLEITGPIQVGQFGKLNSENYNLLLSYIIEGKIWGAEDPKHILKVFVPAFQKEILQEKNISRVTSKLYKAIQQKHIMMYSSDSDIQDLFKVLGLAGNVHDSAAGEDYLSIINIATGGTKSEQFIEEKIHHDTYIDNYGEVINELKITRSHLFSNQVYNNWKRELAKYGFTQMPDYLIDILGRGANKVSTRIYVPEGSAVMDSSGAEIDTRYDKDLKKSYFFIQTATYAGESSEVWIKYKVPFNLTFNPVANYKLVVEKQPGSRGSILTKTVRTGDKVNNLSVYPPEAKVDSSGNIVYPTNLVYDKYFSGIWGK